MRDHNIRDLLKKSTLKIFADDLNSRIIEEFGITSAGARIDIAVINGKMHGFEIKSERDTLQRLPTQIEAYSKVFDYLSVVTEEKHLDGILNCIPSWVGIYICKGMGRKGFINEYRSPKKNLNKNSFYIAKLLWREEIIDILDKKGISFNKRDRNWLLCEILSSQIDENQLSTLVREKLKQRVGWKN